MSPRCPESQQKSHARRDGKLGEESRRWAGWFSAVQRESACLPLSPRPRRGKTADSEEGHWARRDRAGRRLACSCPCPALGAPLKPSTDSKLIHPARDYPHFTGEGTDAPGP